LGDPNIEEKGTGGKYGKRIRGIKDVKRKKTTKRRRKTTS